nr:LETM1 and EF-hand domain-containing protein 1, mitochondrial-like [Tanacetum cinerariifolium]
MQGWSMQSGDLKKTTKDLDEFMNKVRHSGRVSNDVILGFAKLFNNELMLDNTSSPYGTDAYLRYMLRKRLQKRNDDDKMIQAEGVESLSEDELRQAYRDRGLLGMLTDDEMRQQWGSVEREVGPTVTESGESDGWEKEVRWCDGGEKDHPLSFTFQVHRLYHHPQSSSPPPLLPSTAINRPEVASPGCSSR